VKSNSFILINLLLICFFCPPSQSMFTAHALYKKIYSELNRPTCADQACAQMEDLVNQIEAVETVPIISQETKKELIFHAQTASMLCAMRQEAWRQKTIHPLRLYYRRRGDRLLTESCQTIQDRFRFLKESEEASNACTRLGAILQQVQSSDASPELKSFIKRVRFGVETCIVRHETLIANQDTENPDIMRTMKEMDGYLIAGITEQEKDFKKNPPGA
jgi:hypothetical protein